ncbi:MAG: hypothetical protein DCC58_05540 [Chloroflexi bacterium]|nr:MAG: hypothetical protein DCC58_05540 [Chloroflexota bacterium]
MPINTDAFRLKARLSLAGAESEYANGRYDNCVNRCYYACFQAAIAALADAGLLREGRSWSHAFVPGQFDGQMITRRKQFSTSLRGTLTFTYELRQKADYQEQSVTDSEARAALRRTRAFVSAILEQEREIV